MPRVPFELPSRVSDRLRTRYSANKARRIIDRSYYTFSPGATSVRVSTGPLGQFLIESLKKYSSDREAFGQFAGSFDAYIKPVLDEVCSHKGAKTRLESLVHESKRLVDLSVARAHPRIPTRIPTRTSGAPRLYDGLQKRDYLAKIGGDRTVQAALNDLREHELLPKEMLLSLEESQVTRYRRLRATLRDVICREPEEAVSASPSPGDEIYVVLSGSVYDSTGLFETNTEVSEVVPGIVSGESVAIRPADIQNFLDYSLAGGNVEGAPPVNVAISVTLVEHEHSDLEKSKASIKAVVSAVNLLKSAVSGDVVGVVVSLKDLLIALVVLLDGDDELGTVFYEAKDVLSPSTVHETISGTIKDSNNGNDYEYDVNAVFFTEYTTGDAPTFSISGDQNLRSLSEQTKGYYDIDSNSTMSEIVWSVDPSPGTTILDQGKQRTAIKFSIWNDYTVRATARLNANGSIASAELPVTFFFAGEVPGPGGRRPPAHTR